MYHKWNRAFLADLIWTCGQHILFCNIFSVFVYIVHGVMALFVTLCNKLITIVSYYLETGLSCVVY